MMSPQSAAGMKVGVLGGTFDPVHLGHLAAAEAVREGMGLDSVLLIPAALPPHKPDHGLSSFTDRAAMLKLAVEGRCGLLVSEIEGERANASYTVDTLRILHERFGPGVTFYFITGLDAFAELATWKEYEKLPQLANLVVVDRPALFSKKMAQLMADLFADYTYMPEEAAWRKKGVPGGIVAFKMSPSPLSSTEIRARVRAGKDISQMVPGQVAHYILTHKLYL